MIIFLFSKLRHGLGDNVRRDLLPFAKRTRLKLISNFAKDTKSEIGLGMIRRGCLWG